MDHKTFFLFCSNERNTKCKSYIVGLYSKQVHRGYEAVIAVMFLLLGFIIPCIIVEQLPPRKWVTCFPGTSPSAVLRFFQPKTSKFSVQMKTALHSSSELGIATSPVCEEMNTWIVAPLFYILPSILTEPRCISHCALISESISKRLTLLMWTDLGWLQVLKRTTDNSF
jgi:hypothetical protein